ncbi:MAG: tetraacyldisaccharide 4'-kinase [Candidatus Marinimicrobia bacterium]|nr:tetraacyldisaccharide 4'-kinase [Candidatus Neomarinimicrobiota bacterium]
MLSQRNWRRLRPLLWPVAMLYWGVSWWRNLFYRIGFFITRRVEAPVVSIGNLSVGGTGKTPATIYVAGLLMELGYRVGVLSRGYRRESSGTLLVADGKRILASAAESGDEPSLLARRLPGVPVVVDEDRFRGAAFMLQSCPVDVIVLDDGFQHRGLERDCDLVLLDATAPKSAYHIFPYGSLRESVAGLRRADLVLWTRTELNSPPDILVERLMEYDIPQITSRMEAPAQLQAVGSGPDLPAKELRDRRIAAFCGVARPHTFYHALMELGLEPEEVRYFPDHHRYSAADLAQLAALAPDDGWVLITTEKDAVKLPPDFTALQRVYALRVNMVLDKAQRERLVEVLLAKLPPPGGAAKGEA